MQADDTNVNIGIEPQKKNPGAFPAPVTANWSKSSTNRNLRHGRIIIVASQQYLSAAFESCQFLLE